MGAMQRLNRTLTSIVGTGLMLASALVVLTSIPVAAVSLASLNVSPTQGTNS
jgi:hypothetical protein